METQRLTNTTTDVESVIQRNDAKMRRRNRLAAILGAIVIISVISVVVVVLLVVPHPKYLAPFTLDDIGELVASVPVIQWSMNGRKAMYFKNDSVVAFHVDSTRSEPLLRANQVPKALNCTSSLNLFKMSPDGQCILIPCNVVQVFRHSFHADYIIFNVSTNSFINLAEGQLSTIIWSPNSDSMAFVRDGDVYIKRFGHEASRITFDGSKSIISGIPSWIYEEEVLSEALWWSKDGSNVAYLRSDQSNVPEVDTSYDDGSPYRRKFTYHYPKPGYPNPIVTMVIHQCEANTSMTMNLPAGHYIQAVRWVNGSHILVRTIPRVQTEAQLHLCSMTRCEKLNTHFVSKGWVYTIENTPLAFDSQFFIDSEVAGDSLHLAIYSLNSGNIVAWVNEATRLIGAYGQYIYYEAALPTPRDRQIFAFDMQTSTSVPLKLCDDGCFQSGILSPSGQNIAVTDRGPGLPSVNIMTTGGNVVHVVESNSQLNASLATKRVPFVRDVTIPTDFGSLFGKIWLPSRNPGKIPLLVNVYNGPDSQIVTHEFSLGFNAYLTSLGVAVASFDGRGTGNRGRSWATKVFENLGSYEANDQITAAKWLSNQGNFTRMGIWGWSYGGYATLMSLIADVDRVFEVGMAVAPVVDWRFYDSAYTERYMLTPSDNPRGYSTSSVLERASSIKAPLFLAAGLCDDNVHFQNSAELIKKLVELKFENFDVMVYPNNAHSLSRDGARRDVYYRLGQVVLKHLVEK